MPEPTSASYMILIVGVMIISGASGGIVSALLSARDDRLSLRSIIKHTLVGMVTALTIPLLLNLLSSDLIESGQTRPLKLFTLSGLCVSCGCFLPDFLSEFLQADQRTKARVVSKFLKQGTSRKNRERTIKAMHVSSPDKTKTMENQSKILRALAGTEDAKLTLADLMRSAEISQKDFDETLSLLMAKGAVAQELSGGSKLQLVLTTRGRQQLSKMSAG